MSVKQWMAGLLMAVAAMAPTVCRADDFTGEKTLGIKVGYNTYNREPVAGAQFSYRFNRLLRLSPDIEYVFRRDGRDALCLDLNMQFLFPLSGARLNLFPLAGVNFSSWNYHGQNFLGFDPDGLPVTNDVSSRVSRLGVNVGAGLDFSVSGSLKLSLSGVYTFIKEFHGANITAGIHYRF